MDGLSFEAIGQITGAGNSTESLSYTFKHMNVTAGDHYYRLRQTDFDGQEDVSEIIYAYVSTAISATELFPNHVNDNLQLCFSSSVTGDITATITSINGQEILSTTISSMEGFNTHSFNTSTLTPGMYLLRINGNASTDALRFIVLD